MTSGDALPWWEAYQHHRDAIAEMLDLERYTIEWIDAQIWSGAFRTFASAGAIIAVEIKAYPTGAAEIHGMFAAGDLQEILALIEQAEAWGRANGCKFASIASRPGWARLLSGKGYDVDQVTIRKVL